jgi:hypothetical protein
MQTSAGRVILGLCLSAVLGTLSASAIAQTPEIKEKPPLYTYVASWVIPRARWADMAKDRGTNDKVLDHSMAAGLLVAYGDDESLVHTPEGATHSGWWCAMSMAGLFNTLDEFYKNGSAVSPVLTNATRHWDEVYVSRFYDWRTGSVKDGYVHGAVYSLKPEAPADAVALLSRSFVVPLFEKLMGDGSVSAYQIAEQEIHTADPNQFFIFFITPKAEGLDKVNAALSEAIRANSLASPAFGSMVDFSRHRDELGRGDSVFR